MPPRAALKKPAAKAAAKVVAKPVLKKPAAQSEAKDAKGKAKPAGGKRSLEIEKWLEAMAPYYLNVADIEKLGSGEELLCWVFDRNVGDMCFDDSNKGPENAMEPLAFFRNCTMVNLKREPAAAQAGQPWKGISFNMWGSMEDEGDDFAQVLDICVDGVDIKVEKDGKIKKVFGGGGKVPKHWSELPKEATFFCRGPIIPDSRMKLPSHPHVYWGDSDEEE